MWQFPSSALAPALAQALLQALPLSPLHLLYSLKISFISIEQQQMRWAGEAGTEVPAPIEILVPIEMLLHIKVLLHVKYWCPWWDPQPVGGH